MSAPRGHALPAFHVLLRLRLIGADEPLGFSMALDVTQSEQIIKSAVRRAKELGVAVHIALLDAGAAPAQGLELTNDVLVTFAGGIPIKSMTGEVLGAIGVSGGAVPQDFEIASAGLRAYRPG